MLSVCWRETWILFFFPHEARKLGVDFILKQGDSYFPWGMPELSVLGLLVNIEMKHFHVCQEAGVLCSTTFEGKVLYILRYFPVSKYISVFPRDTTPLSKATFGSSLSSRCKKPMRASAAQLWECIGEHRDNLLPCTAHICLGDGSNWQEAHQQSSVQSRLNWEHRLNL